MRKHNKLIQINAICQTSNDYKLFHVVQIEMEQFIRSWAFILLSINHIYWLLIHSYGWIIPNTTGIILRGIFKVYNTSCSFDQKARTLLSQCVKKNDTSVTKRKENGTNEKSWRLGQEWVILPHVRFLPFDNKHKKNIVNGIIPYLKQDYCASLKILLYATSLEKQRIS
jgi:hypothetical protein